MEESVSAESVSDLKTAKFGIQKTRTSQYVFEYKNVWDPVKKRSKPLYRISVGKIIGGEVVIKDEYLQMHPELCRKESRFISAELQRPLNFLRFWNWITFV